MLQTFTPYEICMVRWLLISIPGMPRMHELLSCVKTVFVSICWCQRWPNRLSPTLDRSHGLCASQHIAWHSARNFLQQDLAYFERKPLKIGVAFQWRLLFCRLQLLQLLQCLLYLLCWQIQHGQLQPCQQCLGPSILISCRHPMPPYANRNDIMAYVLGQ